MSSRKHTLTRTAVSCDSPPVIVRELHDARDGADNHCHSARASKTTLTVMAAVSPRPRHHYIPRFCTVSR